MKLYVSNTNEVQLIGLQNESTKAYINDATVTFTLKDADGNVVENLLDQAMAYVTASNGCYKGSIADTVVLQVGHRYFVEVTATKSGVGVGFWRVATTAGYR